MGAIDVGSAAVDSNTYAPAGSTWISLSNPANASGKITSVDVWFNTNATTVQVGIFYLVSGTTYACRSYTLLGSVTAGSKQTFAVNLDVVAGDLIGTHFASGRIEANTSGGSGIMYDEENIMEAGAQSCSYDANYTMSLYGSGSTVWVGTYNGVAAPGEVMGVPNASIGNVDGV